MKDAIQIDSRGGFGLWAIEMAKRIVADQGYELARAARDRSGTTIASLATLLAKPLPT